VKPLFQLFVLLLPVQLAYHLWPEFAFVYGIRVDYLSPTIYALELLWFFIFIVWILKDKNSKVKILKHKRVILVLLLFAILNIHFSEVAMVAVLKWLRIGEFLSLYFFVANQRWVLQSIKVPILVSMVFTLFLSGLQILKGRSVGGILYWAGERSFSASSPAIALVSLFGREFLRPYATFSHPNAMAGYSLVVLFLFIQKEGLIERTLVLVTSALVFLSFSQNAWLALFLSPAAYFVAKRTNGGFVKFVTTAAVASFFLTLLRPSVIARELLQRIELAVVAGKIISLSPLLGIGAGNFIIQLPANTVQRPIWFLQPVHNIFLLLAAEIGLIGLLLFVYFVIRNISTKNSLPVLAILLTGFFDHYWVSFFQNMMLAALVFGCYNAKR
jgi:O-antigen ligase